MSLVSGTKLGPYEILSPLGAGGMGEVYRARDSKLNREVALKVLPAAMANDAERMARFQREAQVLASLNHPNIASIYGLEDSGGVRALVMELVEGPTLAERISAGAETGTPGAAMGATPFEKGTPRSAPSRSPHSLEESLLIAKQIAEALEYAHERSVIHRDLKPANVKITPEGTVKVLDFGLAKALDIQTSGSSIANSPTMSPTLSIAATQAGVILGTAAYMSPEQARGKAVDRRTDIWAFGCVLFEMLSGRKPFDGEVVTDVLAAVVRAEPEWKDLPETNPAPIQKLIRRCLVKDPKQRLRDIGEARIAIEETLTGDTETPTTIGKVHVPSQGDPSGHRGLPWVWIGVAAVVAAALSAWVALHWATSPRQLPLRVIRLDIHKYRVGLSSRPEISPDGMNIAYIINGKLWLQRLEDTNPREVDHGFTEGEGALIWSPDSRSLAYSKNSSLLSVAVSGGPPALLCRLPGAILDGAWTDDNQIIFSKWRGDLFKVPADGGEAKPMGLLNPETEIDFHNVVLLPGKKEFIVVVHPKKGPIRTDIVADGKRRVLMERGWAIAYAGTGHLLFGREGATWAVPFSLSSLKVSGEPIKILEGVIFGVATDGSALYGLGSGPSPYQIVWMNRGGELLQKVGEPLTSPDAMALSPDGSRLAVSAISNGQLKIQVLDLARNVISQAAPGDDETTPVWSPDGKYIYYTTFERFLGKILVVSSDGAGEPREVGPGEFPSVSRSGESLAYEVEGENGSATAWYQPMIPATPVSSAKPVRFLSLTDPALRIWLSPDGKFAAYRSVESEKPEIYLTRFPSGQGRWQISMDGGNEVVWDPHGKEIYYVDLQENLMSVSLNAAPEVRMGKPQLLFNLLQKRLLGYCFDVSPDGKRLIMAQLIGEEADAGGIFLIQDWRALLREAQKK